MNTESLINAEISSFLEEDRERKNTLIFNCLKSLFSSCPYQIKNWYITTSNGQNYVSCYIDTSSISLNKELVNDKLFKTDDYFIILNKYAFVERSKILQFTIHADKINGLMKFIKDFDLKLSKEFLDQFLREKISLKNKVDSSQKEIRELETVLERTNDLIAFIRGRTSSDNSWDESPVEIIS